MSGGGEGPAFPRMHSTMGECRVTSTSSTDFAATHVEAPDRMWRPTRCVSLALALTVGLLIAQFQTHFLLVVQNGRVLNVGEASPGQAVRFVVLNRLDKEGATVAVVKGSGNQAFKSILAQ